MILLADADRELRQLRAEYAWWRSPGTSRRSRCRAIAVDALEERTKYYIEVAQTEVDTDLWSRKTDQGRCAHAGFGRARSWGASGVDRDTRWDDPYAAYGVSFNVCHDKHCDVFSDTLARVGELDGVLLHHPPAHQEDAGWMDPSS